MKITRLVWLLLIIQGISTALVVSDIGITVLGLRARPVPWAFRETLQMLGALGLVLGLFLGALYLRRVERERRRARDQLRIARGAFGEVMEEKFTQWRLTAAERDVALFAIKGMSLAEIAGLRQTSEGTVKAQTGAIYRKAGVSGRAQLISLFVEDLLDDGIV